MSPVPDVLDPDAVRAQISTAGAQSVLAAAAHRLISAYDDFEDALDRRVSLVELQLFDRGVARAERTHAAALSSQADGA